MSWLGLHVGEIVGQRVGAAQAGQSFKVIAARFGYPKVKSVAKYRETGNMKDVPPK